MLLTAIDYKNILKFHLLTLLMKWFDFAMNVGNLKRSNNTFKNIQSNLTIWCIFIIKLVYIELHNIYIFTWYLYLDNSTNDSWNQLGKIVRVHESSFKIIYFRGNTRWHSCIWIFCYQSLLRILMDQYNNWKYEKFHSIKWTISNFLKEIVYISSHLIWKY